MGATRLCNKPLVVFNNYIFDEVDDDGHPTLYADNGAKWVTRLDVGEGLIRLQKGINTVLQWCIRESFKLTDTKIKAMLFREQVNVLILTLKLTKVILTLYKNMHF